MFKDLTEGFSESQCRKFAQVMELADAHDVHHVYLDHFVDQLGGYDKLARSRTISPVPEWIKGITRKFQIETVETQ